jgi:hypothetical protein
MGLSEAREIIRSLANGVDPTTGEVLAPTSPYNNPEIIRALYAAHQSLSGRRSKKSLEEKRRANEEMGRPRNFGLPWTEEARAEVASAFAEGKTFNELAARLERTPTAIRLELINQGLVEAESGRV